jgi:hypothetical protein
MDTATRVKAAADAVKSSIMAPNEARKRYFDLGPVKGGESPYAQQQLFSLATLAERDEAEPFSKPTAAPEADPPAAPDEAEAKRLRAIRRATLEFRRLAAQEHSADAKLLH